MSTSGLSENTFRSKAKTAVVDYWNATPSLVKKFGEINARRVYIVWQVKVLQNSKALLGVNTEGDDRYFEFTFDGDANLAYLDVYKKQTQRVIEY